MSGFSEGGVKVDFVKVWVGKVCERGCGGHGSLAAVD